MASTTEPSPSLAEPSSDTALCLIPPEHLWEPVDRLRSLHDKAYNRWPPHINLVYPFVHPECLQDAAQIISQLDLSSIVGDDDEHRGEEVSQAKIILDEADAFTHKHYSTIHLRPARNSASEGTLARLAKSVRDALGRNADEQFRPHMTIAQSYDPLSASHSFLMDKVRTVTGLSWDITELAILVRDRGHDADSPTQGCMRVWGYVSIDTRQVRQLPVPKCLYPQTEEATTSAAQSVPQTAYHYSASEGRWVPLGEPQAAGTQSATTSIDRLIVASYNVLGEFHWPPNQERYPNLIAHIVSDRGVADILVLEEVTDHFLQYLLSDERVRSRYTYATHAPSNQTDIGPLPNHLNIVVLSRFELQWHHLPFQRKHKGAAIVTFPSLQGPDAGQDGANELPLVLAACHLTHGLVDGAIVCKKNEITRLLSHLSTHYSSHPQIIAGDFNMPTSSYTMDMARKTRHISTEYYRYLRDFDTTLASAGFQDTWLASRIQSGESSSSTFLQDASVEFYEGEQGATFDPLSNSLAAKLVGNGLNNRPQRYDRILVNGRLRLRPGRFNMFGLEPVEGVASQYAGASDHWGIRCLLTVQQQDQHIASSSHTHIRTVQLQKASTSLSGHDELKHFLSKRDLLPTESDTAERHAVINLLRRALQGHLDGDANTDSSKGPQLVLTAVGSFSLGVWTRTSDLDIISVGDIGQKTFIRLAVTRLRKAAGHGITILGKVKALSGTMLQLEVNSIKVDLHYCAATRLLEQFPDVLKRPASDPAWSLPVLTLNKLKPLRDASYLCRSIPDMTQYRLAHLLIKAWAKSRGLYGPKFGLLGGIHITCLLVPVVKMIANEVGRVSVGDIIVTFFHHYANVDWKTQIVLDPFFHSDGINHRRLEREAMCLMGWHAPGLNTALNASAPTVHTIATELSRAHSVLSQSDISWDAFLGQQDADMGAADFLKGHMLYIRIDVNYWGSSSQKRNGLVGWLESRCVMLLVDLGRKVPDLTARIWPQRFIDGQSTATTAPDTGESLEYHGCYLIGLDWVKSKSGQVDKPSSMGELQRALQLFADRIRGDEKYYDGNTCWMGTTVVESGKLGDLQTDHSQIGENAGGDGDDGFSSDEEDEDPEDEAEEDQEVSRLDTNLRKMQLKQGSAPSGGKLRSSIDVMHRIRWDPSLDSANYVVGYEDRFTGIQEKSFELWKGDLTDEEFIPQHRVVYFKRRSDGEIVWDRRTRVDKIFGSGVLS